MKVMIYEDPLTRQKEEGLATIESEINSHPYTLDGQAGRYSYCEVRFPREFGTYQRFVFIPDTSDPREACAEGTA